MKTSNKILLGLLLVVFAVPFILATNIKSKIKKGEYMVKNYENENKDYKRTGSFSAFTVVKVIAPAPDLLRCHLQVSGKMDYTYMNYSGKDSVHVYTSNDTLYIKYVADVSTNNDQNGFRINVNLPAFNNLVIDGAAVVLDSLPETTGNLSVILKNNGELKDGSKKTQEVSLRTTPAKTPSENLVADKLAANEFNNEKEDPILNIGKNKLRQLAEIDIKELLIYSLFYKIQG